MDVIIQALQFIITTVETGDSAVIDGASGVQDYAEAPKRIATGTNLMLKAFKTVYNFFAGLIGITALK